LLPRTLFLPPPLSQQEVHRTRGAILRAGRPHHNGRSLLLVPALTRSLVAVPDPCV